jgi:very-short-patch-repair endonuclease
MKNVSVKYPFYFGATPDIFKKAKELRRYETEAEKRLWSKLCRKIKSRIQSPPFGGFRG